MKRSVSTRLRRNDKDLRPDVIRGYLNAYDLVTLVETGLYNGRGSGMKVPLGYVDRYIAIDRDLDNVTQARLMEYDARHGNSGDVLPDVLAELDAPAVFFLDAHGIDCNTEHPDGPFPGWEHLPLLAELRAIANWEHGARSVVLIDDMPLIAEWVDLGLDVKNGECFDVFLDELPVQWERGTFNRIMRLTPPA